MVVNVCVVVVDDGVTVVALEVRLEVDVPVVAEVVVLAVVPTGSDVRLIVG